LPHRKKLAPREKGLPQGRRKLAPREKKACPTRKSLPHGKRACPTEKKSLPHGKRAHPTGKLISSRFVVNCFLEIVDILFQWIFAYNLI
jgi:hypothetical protein